ncbi:hypothetical protein PIB30_012256 [Stylosanthes scabra]|uniref:Ribonuclease H1 N-terminal domain-containing protein n=1 Tax=Stylosanthes scabra TaxID=79078 RepID=A0ABU6W6P6_9FABA|nr:hypothetical protein [Stylosanthes scabra]
MVLIKGLETGVENKCVSRDSDACVADCDVDGQNSVLQKVAGSSSRLLSAVMREAELGCCWASAVVMGQCGSFGVGSGEIRRVTPDHGFANRIRSQGKPKQVKAMLSKAGEFAIGVLVGAERKTICSLWLGTRRTLSAPEHDQLESLYDVDDEGDGEGRCEESRVKGDGVRLAIGFSMNHSSGDTIRNDWIIEMDIQLSATRILLNSGRDVDGWEIYFRHECYTSGKECGRGAERETQKFGSGNGLVRGSMWRSGVVGPSWTTFENRWTEPEKYTRSVEKKAKADFGTLLTDMSNYTHYAVRVGRAPGIYNTWDEAEEQVLRYPGAQHMGFNSLDEAIEYMNAGKLKKKKAMSSQSVDRLTLHMKNLGVGSSREASTQSQFMRNVQSYPIGGRDGEYVLETQGGGFVIMEEMELYLLCVCMKLNFGWPTFEPLLFTSTSGGMLFSFKAALRCDEKGINVEVDGGICSDQSRAREDAAFNLLDNLLTMTGNSILDFNYRKVRALQQRVEELEQERAENPPARVVALERRCKALKDEIETYQKHLGF